MNALDDTQQTYLTPQKIAHILELKTPRPVYNAINSGALPAYGVGRLKRVKPDDFQTWMESQRIRPALTPLNAPAVSMRDLIGAE